MPNYLINTLSYNTVIKKSRPKTKHFTISSAFILIILYVL